MILGTPPECCNLMTVSCALIMSDDGYGLCERGDVIKTSSVLRSQASSSGHWCPESVTGRRIQMMCSLVTTIVTDISLRHICRNAGSGCPCQVSGYYDQVRCRQIISLISHVKRCKEYHVNFPYSCWRVISLTELIDELSTCVVTVLIS